MAIVSVFFFSTCISFFFLKKQSELYVQLSEHHTAPMPSVQWHSFKDFLWGIHVVPYLGRWLCMTEKAKFVFFNEVTLFTV